MNFTSIMLPPPSDTERAARTPVRRRSRALSAGEGEAGPVRRVGGEGSGGQEQRGERSGAVPPVEPVVHPCRVAVDPGRQDRRVQLLGVRAADFGRDVSYRPLTAIWYPADEFGYAVRSGSGSPGTGGAVARSAGASRSVTSRKAIASTGVRDVADGEAVSCGGQVGDRPHLAVTGSLHHHTTEDTQPTSDIVEHFYENLIGDFPAKSSSRMATPSRHRGEGGNIRLRRDRRPDAPGTP